MESLTCFRPSNIKRTLNLSFDLNMICSYWVLLLHTPSGLLYGALSEMYLHSSTFALYNTQIRRDSDVSVEDLEKGTTTESKNNCDPKIITREATRVNNPTTSTELGHRAQAHIVSFNEEKVEQAVPDGGLRAWLVVLGVCMIYRGRVF